MPLQMEGANPREDERMVKRRKVRKGTQSCWECKRRKVKCIFALPTNAMCDNCARRGHICVSQEYPDEPETHTKTTSDGVEARLSRVEDLLQQLTKNAGTHYPHHSDDGSARETLGDGSEPVTLRGLEHLLGKENTVSNNSIDTTPLSSSEAALMSTSIAQSSDISLVSRYTGLARDLVAAWPTQDDLNHIYVLPIGSSTHFHMQMYAPCEEAISPRTILQLPPPGSHPVLIARKMLLLGSLLQGALSASQTLASMREKISDIMSRVVDTAVRLVTTNDDLTASVEGIECIMLEAMVQNYAGKLHRAWMAVHRASAVAQLISLHRGSKLPSLKVIDPETRASFDADQLCFRIVEMDCYLSVTLGLPQSSLETCVVTSAVLARCQPLDRMARLQCIIAGRILVRQGKESSRNEPTDMHETDRLLQQAATEMPPRWWMIPDFESSCDPFREVARINYQLSHHHLLIRLHLPYMLHSPKDGIHDHSKIAAVNSSREVLSRYIAFRRWNPGNFYCRGIDFLAFIAFTVLSLAHIDSRNTAEVSLENAQSSTNVGKVLAHSYPSDRGMMECTLLILDGMRNDVIASKLACTMQHLLDVEADAAKGARYSAVATKDDDGAAECDGDFIHGGNTLQLHIPYFGTINLQRGSVSKSAQIELFSSNIATIGFTLPDQGIQQGQRPFSEWDGQCSQQPHTSYDNLEIYNNDTDLPELLDPTNYKDAPDDGTLQSVNEALFNSLFSGVDSQDSSYNIWTASNY